MADRDPGRQPAVGHCDTVRLLLHRLGVGYERRELDVVDRSDRARTLGTLNPAPRVPTLVLDDGRALAESGAILWYLAQGTPWWPADDLTRAQVLQWMFFEQYSHEPHIAVLRVRAHALYAYTHVAHEGGFDLTPLAALRRWCDRVAALPGHIAIDA